MPTSTDAHKSWRLRNICKFGVCFSLALQVVGFVTPGWFYSNSGSSSLHIGLWYSIVCLNGGPCITGPMSVAGNNDASSGLNTFVLEFQIETCLAIVLCIVALVSAFLYARCKRNSATLNVIYTVASMLSGVLALIAAGKMGYMLGYILSLADVSLKFPYSLFFTGVGGLLGIIVALLLILDVHLASKDAPVTENNVPLASIQISDNKHGRCNNSFDIKTGS